MFSFLNQGTWTKPSDKMAVYTEILPNQQWGIRVTLLADSAKVEAINGPKCTWYRVSPELVKTVRPPSFFERLKGITFEDKLKREVEAKRAYARQRNLENK